MKKIFNLLLVLIFFLLGFVLHIENPDPVSFSFPFIEWDAPLGLLLLLAVFTGLILGASLMSMSLFKSKLAGSKAKKQLVKVEKEVENLRAMPIKDEV